MTLLTVYLLEMKMLTVYLLEMKLLTVYLLQKLFVTVACVFAAGETVGDCWLCIFFKINCWLLLICWRHYCLWLLPVYLLKMKLLVTVSLLEAKLLVTIDCICWKWNCWWLGCVFAEVEIINDCWLFAEAESVADCIFADDETVGDYYLRIC